MAAPSKAKGHACGYFTKVALFGGPPELRGCGQTVPPGSEASAGAVVDLPAGGSGTSVTAQDDGAIAQYGPAVIFGDDSGSGPSGPMKVSTKGKTTVTSSAEVKDFSTGPFWAASVRSSATASKSGTKGSTTISKGVLVLAGDESEPEKVPSRPQANLTFKGVNNVGDKFKVVFNEQKVARDGTITVTAVHLYLLGPTAKGDVVIAQSVAKV